MKEFIVSKLNQLEDSLRRFRKKLDSIESNFVSRKEIRETSQHLAKIWFEEIEINLPSFEIDGVIISKYGNLFEKLLKLGMGSQRKKSYLTTINKILSDFKVEL